MKIQITFPTVRIVASVLCVGILLTSCGKRETEEKKEEAAPVQGTVDNMSWSPDGMGAPVGSTVGYMVQVDGRQLSAADLERRVDRLMMIAGFNDLQPMQMMQARESIKPDAINEFIGETLLFHDAEKQGVKMDDAQVDEQYAKIIGTAPPGTDIEMVLKQRGMTTEGFKADIKRDLTIQAYLKPKLPEERKPTDEDVRKFFDDNTEQFVKTPGTAHARHILVACNSDSTPEERVAAQAKIAEAREKAIDGGDFEELAKEYSDCPSRDRGGDLGTFDRSRMVPEFADAAFAQDVDEIGEVVQTQFGYHVLQVLERTPEEFETFDKVEEGIAEFLEKQVLQQIVSELIQVLGEKADIKYGDYRPAPQPGMGVPFGPMTPSSIPADER